MSKSFKAFYAFANYVTSCPSLWQSSRFISHYN